ncbi:MAG: hypothetical protein SGJ24_00060 [Chloroflexota bacterium]|nr:hypothetical protein [Chloroflexota bacterium]
MSTMRASAALRTTTLLYTGGLRGDLDLLPRVVTFLKGLRAEFAADQIVLLDVGEACADESWHCAATDGRSMLMALDGMGCDAANVTGYLSPEGRARLVELGDSFRLRLLEHDQVYAVVQTGTPPLTVALGGTRATQFVQQTLTLMGVKSGDVGVAHCVYSAQGWRLESSGIYVMPAGTPPDSTLAGLVDFIRAEARAAQKRRGMI